MPTITIYLTNDLYDKVRMSPSKIVRAALEYYFKSDSANKQSQESEHAQQRTKESKNKHAPPTAH